MNKGLAKATGNVVGFLNSADFYADASELEKILNAFQDPALDACYADLENLNQDNSQVLRYWKSKLFTKDEHISNPGVAIASILNRKRPRMLFFVVPDWASRHRFDSRFAAHDVPPNHLTLWNRKSLEKLLDHHGYEVQGEEVAEIRRCLLGHIFRNRSVPSPASIVDWAHALAVPPAF